MNWRAFLSGMFGGLLVVSTLTFPVMRAAKQGIGGTAQGLSGPSTLPSGTTATTQSAGDNSTKLATTAYTDAAVAAVSGAPSGSLLILATGTCPTGYTQNTALNGAMPYGTIAANGDIGGTGGANTVTPTVATLTAAAQSFSGNAGTVPAEAFTGTPFSSVINHTHTVTVTYQAQGGTSAATTGTHSMTSTATGGSARSLTSGDVVSATTANPSGGVASITPAGTNGTVSFTPAGSNGTSSVTGTLNSFDNRPAFVKVIFCQKS